MRNVLILDTETTGLDLEKDKVIEVAVVLYSIEYATIRESFSALLSHYENPCEHINRIPAAVLPLGRDCIDVWRIVDKLSDQADAIVAHNAEFDRKWCPKALQDRQWICSKSDLQWPKQTRPEPSLVMLALEHDLGVAYAHRAMVDCDMIARLFTRARELGVNLDDMLRRGMRPKVELQALVSYDDRELAKTAGFRWDAPTKRWLRRMVLEDVAGLPFKTREVST